jgi:uncharacterized membrane protein YbhN (UPF0104 family)
MLRRDRPRHRPRAGRLVLQVLLMLVAVGLLALAIWSNRAQVREVLSRPINAPLFALALALYLGALGLTFFRWFLLVRALGLPFRLRDALRLGAIGHVFNLVIPGAVGGDVIKGAFLCREQARRTQAVASMIIDRAVGLLGLFLLAGASGLTIWGEAPPEVRRLITVVWAAAAAGFVGLAVLFTPALYRPLFAPFRRNPRLAVLLDELVTMAAAYRSRLGTVGLALALAVFTHSMFVLIFYTASRAIFPGGLPSLGQHFLLVPLTLFTTAIPLPFGALGLSEQISGGLFRLAGHDGGAVAMMAFRVVMYASGALCLPIYLANLRQVRELEAEAAGPDAGRLAPVKSPSA